jgi:hypothetical protein
MQKMYLTAAALIAIASGAAHATTIVSSGDLTGGAFVQGSTSAANYSIAPVSEFAWFTFSANAGDALILDVNRTVNGNMDPIAFVHFGNAIGGDTNLVPDASDLTALGCVFVLSSDDPTAPAIPGPFGDPYAVFLAPATGVYTVIVSNFLGNQIGPGERYHFEIAVTGRCPAPAWPRWRAWASWRVAVVVGERRQSLGLVAESHRPGRDARGGVIWCRGEFGASERATTMIDACDARPRGLLVTTPESPAGSASSSLASSVGLKPQARLVKGFRDVFAADLSLKQRLIDTVRGVYERYGYMPLETPSVEYVDVLGKFLPESVTPAGGIFAFRNPDLGRVGGGVAAGAGGADEWVSLRYDLTAPLARVAAQYAQDLPKPYRRYQVGSVFRYEKPGPGRFREFTQFDFDAVGVSSMAADAEACCVMCDALEALGFGAGEYAVRVNNRKIMQGVLESCGVAGGAGAMGDPRALVVLRAITPQVRN